MAVYPPQNLSQKTIETIVDYTKRLAIGLNCIGMMNVQFVIFEDDVYVIEVNPRASRTAPFLSKVTNIPMAQVATKVILGQSLKELGYEDGLYATPNLVHVKAPVFSFTKLNKVDTYLGPEMKSTGEVMGSDQTLAKALYKAFEASGLHIPEYGTAFFTIADETKEEALALAKRFTDVGFSLTATTGTAAYFKDNGLLVEEVAKLDEEDHNVIERLQNGTIQIAINTMDKNRNQQTQDTFRIRREAVEHGVPLLTSLDTADAILKVMEARAFATNAI